MKRWQIGILCALTLVCLGLGVFVIEQKRNSADEANPGDAQEISGAQVSQHNTVDSCWVIIGTKVFNATAYLVQHPDSDIKASCGAEAQTDKKTTDALGQFYIGLLVP